MVGKLASEVSNYETKQNVLHDYVMQWLYDHTPFVNSNTNYNYMVPGSDKVVLVKSRQVIITDSETSPESFK